MSNCDKIKMSLQVGWTCKRCCLPIPNSHGLKK
nr:MAG TPA: hypothetical protein [Caudoviricetes sp.]